MANFKPLKRYLLKLLDDLSAKHGFSEPFLDVGGGIGDVALHWAKKGWSGTAIEISPSACAIARETLLPYSGKISVVCGDFLEHQGRYGTIFFCDVLEHIPNDSDFLAHARTLMTPESYLAISVPVFKKEWRWDDDYYGHLRRYEIGEMRDLLQKNGFELLEVWDFTFPFFWLLRRIYTRIIPPKLPSDASMTTRTAKSSLQSAWDNGRYTRIVEKLVWWAPLLYIQSRLKTSAFGCECIFVAKLIA